MNLLDRNCFPISNKTTTRYDLVVVLFFIIIRQGGRVDESKIILLSMIGEVKIVLYKIKSKDG